MELCFLQIFIGSKWIRLLPSYASCTTDENILGLVIDNIMFKASVRDVCSPDTTLLLLRTLKISQLQTQESNVQNNVYA